mgnify:FL=1
MVIVQTALDVVGSVLGVATGLLLAIVWIFGRESVRARIAGFFEIVAASVLAIGVIAGSVVLFGLVGFLGARGIAFVLEFVGLAK